jgi:hypothetical protein
MRRKTQPRLVRPRRENSPPFRSSLCMFFSGWCSSSSSSTVSEPISAPHNRGSGPRDHCNHQAWNE